MAGFQRWQHVKKSSSCENEESNRSRYSSNAYRNMLFKNSEDKAQTHTALLTWLWWCFWSWAAVSPCWGIWWFPPGWDARQRSGCPLSAPRCWCWWRASESWWVPRSDLRGSSYLKTEDRKGRRSTREKRMLITIRPNDALLTSVK